MAQLGEAIARYHRLLESPEHRDLSWAEGLQEAMRARRLTEAGRLVTPVLRPHFITLRQHEALTKAANGVTLLLERIQNLALQNPQLLARLHLLPAEKMLAMVPAGYTSLNVSTRLDGHSSSTVVFNGLKPRTPATVPYAEDLSELFLELPIVKEFKRGHYKLSKLNSGKHLYQGVVKTWKEFGDPLRTPQAAIVEFGQQFSGESHESQLLSELFTTQGIPTSVVSPDQLRYQGGVLHGGNGPINMVFRRFRTQELLLRYDLAHPLLNAYRDGAICVINGFRSELAERRALFALLTDDNLTASWSAAERQLIRDHVAWTRVVVESKTSRHDTVVDLPDFIVKNRDSLVLLPNDDSAEQPAFYGSELTQAAWGRAVNTALRSPYVVQDAVLADPQVFPLYSYGELQMKSLQVTVHPHQVLGQAQGLSATLSQTAQAALVPVAHTPALLLQEI
jgi:hypothetical protein